MKHIAIVLIGITFASNLWAGTIIDITRRLRMTAAEALPPRDLMLDMGTRDGLREGDVLTVYRVIPVINALVGTSHHLMKIPLGEVKVVTLGEATSLARVHVQRDVNDLPALVSQSFMLGDQVQLKSSLPFQ